LIHEVNLDTKESRIYELQAVINRPNFTRVTYYGVMTPTLWKIRGKNVYRSLASLREFV
jgi:hypothetical protein